MDYCEWQLNLVGIRKNFSTFYLIATEIILFMSGFAV